ncbi:hypothetical protein L6164_001984 [Bauhinia variegata]|uniref:Uncharacterized protein n=1 Tax=Bauhinia variegata TaxID=167791 RepID=A0ACB9QEQ0_BAUVA|nr:hypothetical protein L6164_001984 [Bauhinia variegata]
MGTFRSADNMIATATKVTEVLLTEKILKFGCISGCYVLEVRRGVDRLHEVVTLAQVGEDPLTVKVDHLKTCYSRS